MSEHGHGSWHEDPYDPGSPTQAADLAALWAGLRLVVLDVENVISADGPHLVEVAIATCRGDKRTSRTWVARVNPGVPVDPRTFAVHGITDEDLADEPPFATLEPELTRRLRGLAGENVVLVAHNASHDIGVLRREYRRLDLEMPDLPVLDTRRLPRLVGIRPAGEKLEHLAAALGIRNPAPHTALGDTETTAELVLSLLRIGASHGERDFEHLRARVMARRADRTSTMRAAGRGRTRDRDDVPAELVLPVEHTTGHTSVLSSDDADEVRRWQAALTECGRLRCSHAGDRVAAATPDSLNVLAVAEQVLDTLAAPSRADVPAVATILGALSPLLAGLPDRKTALAWHDRWQPRLAPLGRCDPADRHETACPSCRTGQPCALDTWTHHLAPAALGQLTAGSLKSTLHVTGTKAGTGTVVSWFAQDRPRLAEYTAWLTYLLHRNAGQVATSDTFAQLAYNAGLRDPRLTAAYARLLAAPGDERALLRGIDTCTDALSARQGSTDDGWTALGAKRSQLAGLLERQRATVGIDADGNTVFIRRHHPEEPRRAPRRRRFALDG